jgi:hypothetical protein
MVQHITVRIKNILISKIMKLERCNLPNTTIE